MNAALAWLPIAQDDDGDGRDAPFPSASRPRRSTRHPRAATSRESLRPRVLLVEDDMLHREALGTVLARGFDVSEATTGRKGLAEARTGRFDVIMLDVRLPDLSGLEVLRRIKLDPETRHVPVVILTAVGTQEDRDRAFEHGCEAFLTKPPNLAHLLDLLTDLGSRCASAVRPIGPPRSTPSDEE